MVIILQQRQVWRRSSAYCNSSTIAMGGLIGAGDIVCISLNCFNLGILASASAPCVSFSAIDDWSVSESSTVINIPANVTIEAAFQGLLFLQINALVRSFIHANYQAVVGSVRWPSVVVARGL